MNESVLWMIAVTAFVFGAFYSGSETALIACNRIRMRHLANKGNRRARLVLDLLDDPEYFLSAVLVGTNFAVIGCTTTFTAICTRHFGDHGGLVATVILVPLVLIFNEIIPKGLFLLYANRAALGSVYLLRALSTVLYPVIKFFSTLADLLTRLLPGTSSKRRFGLGVEELLFHIGDSGEAGVISPETTVLAKRALELKELRVRDVMVPLERTVMVEYDCTQEHFRQAFVEAGYSRLPVYRDSRENVVGVLSVHELMKHPSPDEIHALMRPPYTVDIDAPLAEILLQMKEHGRHMGMVLDADSRMVGMATLEDILEQFVGAIADEFN